MSTERKPGSRGVTQRHSIGQDKSALPRGADADGGAKRNPKGSTKTASHKQSFKRKRKK